MPHSASLANANLHHRFSIVHSEPLWINSKFIYVYICDVISIIGEFGRKYSTAPHSSLRLPTNTHCGIQAQEKTVQNAILSRVISYHTNSPIVGDNWPPTIITNTNGRCRLLQAPRRRSQCEWRWYQTGVQEDGIFSSFLNFNTLLNFSRPSNGIQTETKAQKRLRRSSKRYAQWPST